MSQLTSASYDAGIASLEIILLLAAAFIAGILVCYLLRLFGLCCRKKVVIDSASLLPPDDYQPQQIEPQQAEQAESQPHPAAISASAAGSSYEAEIGRLIRNNDDHQPPARQVMPVVDTASSLPATSTGTATTFEERAQASLAGLQDNQTPTTANIDYTLDIPVPDADHIDDLTKLEGIDSAVEKLLNDHGIKNYAKLATMDRDYLKKLLEAEGTKFSGHEPKSWPYQAELAAKDNWSRLRDYQDFLLADRN